MTMAVPPPDLRVGGHTVPLEEAEEWVRAYTDVATNRRTKKPYAFPGYDHFNDRGDLDHLSDGDLLAPVLLNVGISVRSFYELQRIRPDLEPLLQEIPADVRLEDIDDTHIREWVGSLFAVLNSPAKPWGVSATKLSKVLHRKRPHLLVLHDRQVANCYRVPLSIPTPGRSWADYMVDLSLAIADDLRTQQQSWDRLNAAVGPDGPISRVRFLDIVAWHLGT